MKLPAISSFFCTLFACSVVLLSSVSAAQDGPIRQGQTEHAMPGEQPKPAPNANMDAVTKITQPGDYPFSIQHDGLTRMYLVHVPPRYNPATPTPLLFALHGRGRDMGYMANDTEYGLITKSDHEGFVVVFPNGFSKLKSGKLASWNAGNCCADTPDQNIDDVGFIRRVAANVTHQMNIDRHRIYATGMSNGGMMVYRLACEMSDVFSAVASVAGTDNTRSCHPKYPVSVLHIHASNDTRVPFTGGTGPYTSDKSKFKSFTSVADTIAKWVQIDGCTTPSRRILEKNGAYCDVYSPCQGNTQVELCVTETGDHSWPGGVKPSGEKQPSQAISADDIMWDFFSRR